MIEFQVVVVEKIKPNFQKNRHQRCLYRGTSWHTLPRVGDTIELNYKERRGTVKQVNHGLFSTDRVTLVFVELDILVFDAFWNNCAGWKKELRDYPSDDR